MPGGVAGRVGGAVAGRMASDVGFPDGVVKHNREERLYSQKGCVCAG